MVTSLLQDQLQFRDGDNPIMQKVFDLYLHFLQTSQSEAVQRHAFGALRSFINKVCVAVKRSLVLIFTANLSTFSDNFSL